MGLSLHKIEMLALGISNELSSILTVELQFSWMLSSNVFNLLSLQMILSKNSSCDPSFHAEFGGKMSLYESLLYQFINAYPFNKFCSIIELLSDH